MNLKIKSTNKKSSLIIFSLFIIMVLTGCRSNDLFGDEAENVTSIEVRDHDSDEFITTITDSSFINSLVEELEYANSSSTAMMDIPNADYRLLFLDSEDIIIQEIDYYIEEIDFGVVGRYHASDLHLAVTTELPLEENE